MSLTLAEIETTMRYQNWLAGWLECWRLVGVATAGDVHFDTGVNSELMAESSGRVAPCGWAQTYKGYGKWDPPEGWLCVNPLRVTCRLCLDWLLDRLIAQRAGAA